MNRTLLILVLLGEAFLLFAESPDIPYPGKVRWVSFALGVAAIILVVPVLWSPERETGRRVNLFHVGKTEEVFLGAGGAWDKKQAQGYWDEGLLRPAGGKISLPFRYRNRNVLVLGTTGSGKTRMLELLISHAVLRQEPVVVIDPKGDERLLRCVKEACRQAGRQNKFRLFSIPQEPQSCFYNPLARFGRVEEVADRVAALMPSTGDSLPFRNFGWEVVYTVSRVLHGLGEAITFSALHRYGIQDPWDLVRRSVEQHSGREIHGPKGEKLARTYERKVREGVMASRSELDAMIALAGRPRDHYEKMVASLSAVLSKLAAQPLLSKDGIRWDEVSRGQVVYFDLGSMIAPESTAAMARVLLLDLHSYLGRRYADRDSCPLSVTVDESADVVSPEFVGMLAKGRGAGLRLVLAAQSLADFEAALGSRALTGRLLGNINSMIQFRASSLPDAESFSALAGDCMLSVSSEGENYEPALLSSGWRSVDDFRASFSVQRRRQRAPLVEPSAILNLPAFSFFLRTPEGVEFGHAPLLELSDEAS